MDRFWVYILKSTLINRYYCGSSNDIERRLKQHNDINYTSTKTTKRFPGPWEIIWSEQHATRSRAMEREKQIKKRGIKRFLEKMIIDIDQS